MKILLFHPTLLPPRDYGGVERIVLWLAKGLRERGHEVWVAAYPGSQLPLGAKLWAMPPERSSPSVLLEDPHPTEFDLIHFFTPPGEKVASQLQVPFVFTLQGNGQAGEEFPKNTVFISRNHAERHGGEVYVYNSVDPAEFVFEPVKKGPHCLFLSKTSWSVKNLAGAMSRCRKAKTPLKIAGGDRPFSLRAWAGLSGYLPGHPKFEWIGPVNGKKKADLLAGAKGFLFPVIWPEPFGIVMAEALVSGTPVLGSRRGSVPELVSSDVGAVLDSEEEWVDWLSKERWPWEPEACRDRALKLFHYQVMVENYEKIYRRMGSGENLHARVPVAKPWSVG